jgi:lambda family phage tail tape measure protein
MPAPALSIPVRANLDDFKSKMADVGSHTSSIVRQVVKNFDEMNAAIIAGSTRSAARMALNFAGSAVAIVAAVKAIGAISVAVREQLSDMVAVADKAANLSVSPKFFQEFVSEAQRLKVSTEAMEGALQHAFDATKEKSPIDLSEWEVGEEKISDVEKVLRVYNETVAKAAGTKLEGLVLFRDADTQEQKVTAVLKAMVELNGIGHQLEALQLGEKMFGSQFVDNIRLGKTSAESILAAMSKAAAAGSGVFSNEMVLRAKEIDDKLKEASERLTRELKPQWDGLATTVLTIKSLWADVVDLIGKAASAANRVDLAIKKDRLASVTSAIDNGTGIGGLPQTNFFADLTGGKRPQDRLKDERDQLQREIAILEGRGRSLAQDAGLDDIGGSRGTGAAPKKKVEDASSLGRDRLDTAADSIEKRTAALNAEAATIDLGTQARERSKIAAELETLAKQLNAAAGKDGNTISAEQRERIDAVADAYGRAALKIEQAHSPLATFARESANLNTQLNAFAASSLNNMTDELANVVTGTKSVQDAFKSMAASILQDLARIAIRQAITGPLARGLMGALGSIGGGPVNLGNAGGTGGGLGGLYAVGGYVRGPGSSTSDSIIARLSDREFVVNAEATAQNRGLLEMINAGRVRGFADGGLVTAASTVMPNSVVHNVGSTQGDVITYAPNITITGAQAVTPEQLATVMENERKQFYSRTQSAILRMRVSSSAVKV